MPIGKKGYLKERFDGKNLRKLIFCPFANITSGTLLDSVGITNDK